MLSNYLLYCSQFFLLGTLGTHWEVQKTQSERHGNLVRTLWEHHNPKTQIHLEINFGTGLGLNPEPKVHIQIRLVKPRIIDQENLT